MSQAQLSQLNDFSVLKLSGEDAYSFLHGQVTCDVNLLKQQKWLPGCHCNAKGKMWSSFIAIQSEQDILLVMTKDSAAASLAELNKYGVFAKVDISDDTESWKLYGSNESLEQAVNVELANNHYLVLSTQELETTSTPEIWWQQEILSGRAHLFKGSIGEFVPQMLNLQALDYISFNKGCYMGQEMVARMRYLGKNKRALYLAKIAQAVSVQTADDVAIELNGNKRSIGKVVHSQVVQDSTYLQLVLPKDTELNETLYLESGHTLELLELPYQLEQ